MFGDLSESNSGLGVNTYKGYARLYVVRQEEVGLNLRPRFPYLNEISPARRLPEIYAMKQPARERIFKAIKH